MDFPRRRFLRHALSGAAAALAAPLSGCGLLLHPERNGQPHSGRLDPSIVILDAVGCIFFLVPGLIAFIVDFSTGTIYLPPDSYGQADQPLDSTSLVAVKPDAGPLSRRRIEEIVEEKTGRPVDLESPDVRARRLTQIEECDAAAMELAASDAPPARVAFD